MSLALVSWWTYSFGVLCQQYLHLKVHYYQDCDFIKFKGKDCDLIEFKGH